MPATLVMEPLASLDYMLCCHASVIILPVYTTLQLPEVPNLNADMLKNLVQLRIIQYNLTWGHSDLDHSAATHTCYHFVLVRSSKAANCCRSELELGELRNRIVRMLFKQLTASNGALVELAHQALAVIINHTRMPKVPACLYSGRRCLCRGDDAVTTSGSGCCHQPHSHAPDDQS